jgi:hypothetical protein
MHVFVSLLHHNKVIKAARGEVGVVLLNGCVVVYGCGPHHGCGWLCEGFRVMRRSFRFECTCLRRAWGFSTPRCLNRTQSAPGRHASCTMYLSSVA